MINSGSKTLKEISAVIKVALLNDTCVGRLVIFFFSQSTHLFSSVYSISGCGGGVGLKYSLNCWVGSAVQKV